MVKGIFYYPIKSTIYFPFIIKNSSEKELYYATYNAIINLQKESTHSKVDAPKVELIVLTDVAYPVGRQDRHFYFRLFLLSRKASNAINKLPKDFSKANTPIKTEMISNAVIYATSLPMYFG